MLLKSPKKDNKTLLENNWTCAFLLSYRRSTLLNLEIYIVVLW